MTNLTGYNSATLPRWVRLTLPRWCHLDASDVQTPGIENALKWGEIRGAVHCRHVMEEVKACLKENVLADQVQPLYAAYGWLSYHCGLLH